MRSQNPGTTCSKGNSSRALIVCTAGLCGRKTSTVSEIQCFLRIDGSKQSSFGAGVLCKNFCFLSQPGKFCKAFFPPCGAVTFSFFSCTSGRGANQNTCVVPTGLSKRYHRRSSDDCWSYPICVVQTNFQAWLEVKFSTDSDLHELLQYIWSHAGSVTQFDQYFEKPLSWTGQTNVVQTFYKKSNGEWRWNISASFRSILSSTSKSARLFHSQTIPGGLSKHLCISFGPLLQLLLGGHL